MAASCGPLTIVCVLVLLLVAFAVTMGGHPNAIRGRAEDLTLRSMRSMEGQTHQRRGGEGVAVDNAVATSGGRQRPRGGGNGRNNTVSGGRREGNRSGGRSQGRGRGRVQRGPFSKKQTGLLSQLSQASGQLALRTYGALRQTHRQLVFSPYSVHTALTMTYMGARNTTMQQMLSVLNLQRLRKDKAHQAYAALTSSLNHAANVTLNIASAVYVKPNFPVENAFRQGLQNLYNASFGHFEYRAAGGPEAPINDWVAQRTENEIRNLLSPGTVTPATTMVIVNAIYFKGTWRDQFDPVLTTEQPFYRDDGTTTQVFLMRKADLMSYSRSEELSSHLVEVPYAGDRLSMFIVLPLSRNGLAAVEGALTLQLLDTATQSMRSTSLDFFLPRFKIESKFSLKETLIDLGMKIPFDPARANFAGICPNHALYISDVIHQAVVEVTEEGTVAAAATGVFIRLRSARMTPRPLVVRADHPFIFAIRDCLTGTWLFVGKYSAA